MGDMYSDAQREDRRARARQAKIDKFFDFLIGFFTDEAKPSQEDARTVFKAFDTLLHRGGANLAMSRQDERCEDFIMMRLHGMLIHVRHHWAWLLTLAKMHASRDRFEALRELSPYAGKPVVVIVPNGEYREPRILGDWRKLCESIGHGSRPCSHTVLMPERSVKGVRQTADGSEEMHEPGFDDIRFLSVAV